MPPDYTTDVGKVRALIPDNGAEYLFEDEEIEAFLAVSGGSVKGATALAIYAIATNEVLTYKYVKTDDLLIDGSKAADFLLKRAASLEAGAAEEGLTDDFVIVYPQVFPIRPEATARWC